MTNSQSPDPRAALAVLEAIANLRKQIKIKDTIQVAVLIRELDALEAALPSIPPREGPLQSTTEQADASRDHPVREAVAQPRVIDDDASEITVTFNGHELRGWSYADDAERRIKMLCAREYVEGWCDGRQT